MMHKDTLANIVIRAVRQANSVIDSSYEFPDVEMRINDELNFRDNLLKYCREYSNPEKRELYRKGLLEYVASLYDDEREETIPYKIIELKKDKALYLAFGLLSVPAAVISYALLPQTIYLYFASILGFVFGPRRFSEAKLKEKEISNAYIDAISTNAIAKELREVSAKDFDTGIYDHWEDIQEAYNAFEKPKGILE